jgi:hypothetical protein
MQIDTQWWITNWPYVVIVLLMVREFINNLLLNCPFLKANRGFELIQGIFNAAAATVTKSSSSRESSTKDIVNTPQGTTVIEEKIDEKAIPVVPDTPVV